MELIRIQQHNGNQVVSARELHNFLECKRDFSNWIKDRIEKYGFIENQDFEVFNNFGENPNGGRPLKEYALTIDTAKEIAMVEGNEKGKQARRYFIECEKKLKVIQHPSIPQSYSEALKLAYEQSVKIEDQQKQLQDQRPLVVFAEALQISDHCVLIGELAKILKQNNFDIGQNRLFDHLRSNGYLMSKGEQRNLPTQRSLELGLFEVKTTTINNPDGSIRVSKTTKVTPKGQKYFINKLIGKDAA